MHVRIRVDFSLSLALVRLGHYVVPSSLTVYSCTELICTCGSGLYSGAVCMTCFSFYLASYMHSSVDLSTFGGTYMTVLCILVFSHNLSICC